MGRPPAYIFVVRHGNRLDAADKQWHLTSPAPYDPPLTYGGWQQCKTLGARIASILRDREAEDEAAQTSTSHSSGKATAQSRKKKKKRYKVILHSSPFLRCIQTSIAISAGMASNTYSRTQSTEHVPLQAKRSRINQISSFSNPAPSPSRPTISTDVPPTHQPHNPAHIDKTILRLDPFLGEWASPDYFEHITPPPNSNLMLMTAKADLLRKENYDTYPHFNTRPSITPTTPSQLWNSPTATHNSGLDNLPRIGEALPGNGPNEASEWKAGHKASLSETAISVGYVAPVPSHAVSSMEPIPHGYVAHARDQCVDFDYQWDSTRDPVTWGEGGVLPEEWAAMHGRFRKGLKRLVDWYSTAEHPGQMVTKTPTTPNSVKFDGSPTEECAVDEDDVEIENVVILVSHGAGCNALVGGITNQPVLADVPMSSLSMARRRAQLNGPQALVDERASASLEHALLRDEITVPELYELPMFANTAHLTGSANVSRSSSVNGGSRGRDLKGFSSALRDINFGARYNPPRDHRSNSLSASLESMRRTPGGPSAGAKSPSIVSSDGTKGGITVGSGVTSFGTAGRKSSWGLWTPKQQPQDPDDDPDLPMTLDFSYEKETVNKSPPPEPIVEVPEHETEHLPVLLAPTVQGEDHDAFDTNAFPSYSSASGSGLWGTPRPPDDAEKLRDFSSQKRRWTVTERQPVT
ncbi:hypothetical protein BKA67DRAFT_11004 [Truncatella angustata]|uniref:Phosphoglycerate mutase n=1 Tax=Truncatella angustata TaxID=152316 RepID=A0A9P8UVV9_9PEZI|nr:uncharacterized protein BKA67DRAFT_11004 [Truncatella angustata]KAH6659338.1 hypothetical protein BKA67DRAFT_11004 [Truncatella angustata]